MPVIYQKRICRDDLRRNPNAIYLFGDNEARTGLGGQAREMRAEPNAFGIATKKSPYEFWSDKTFENNKLVINADFERLARRCSVNTIVVIPSDGIGTGLADLQNRAPKTWQYLQQDMRVFIVCLAG